MKNLNYVSTTGGNIEKRLAALENALACWEKWTMIPVYTTAERTALSDPELGYMVFDSTLDTPYVYKAGGWAAV